MKRLIANETNYKLIKFGPDPQNYKDNNFDFYTAAVDHYKISTKCVNMSPKEFLKHNLEIHSKIEEEWAKLKLPLQCGQYQPNSPSKYFTHIDVYYSIYNRDLAKENRDLAKEKRTREIKRRIIRNCYGKGKKRKIRFFKK
jgi:hypothetical protein